MKIVLIIIAVVIGLFMLPMATRTVTEVKRVQKMGVPIKDYSQGVRDITFIIALCVEFSLGYIIALL